MRPRFHCTGNPRLSMRPASEFAEISCIVATGYANLIPHFPWDRPHYASRLCAHYRTLPLAQHMVDIGGRKQPNPS